MNVNFKNCVALAAIALGLASCASQETNNALTIEGGLIEGVQSADPSVTVFKGVPYAAAPVGDLRFKRPQPVTPWDTVMIADHFGKAATQPGRAPGSFYYKEFQLTGPFEQSEDCLYLNVWAPTATLKDKNAKLPVALWIHGGAYINGAGHDDAFDGDEWAKRGVILVTINYRLGVMGFFSHEGLSAENEDGQSGNYGTYDQVAALKWVYNNIAEFGGDPEQIMIFGQSAGAASIKNLVSSPLAIPMIHRAIIQSGGGLGHFIPTQHEVKLDSVGKAAMDSIGLTSVEKIRKASTEEVLAVLKDRGAMRLCSPHKDPTLLPEDFTSATLNNHLANVEIMIGCNGDDMGDMRPDITRFAEVRDSLGNKATYTYFFDRKLPGDDSGSFHSAELWYTFGTLARSWRPWADGDYKLSAKMIDFWTNFTKYGNPNGKDVDGEWKPSTKANPYMQFFDIEKTAE